MKVTNTRFPKHSIQRTRLLPPVCPEQESRFCYFLTNLDFMSNLHFRLIYSCDRQLLILNCRNSPNFDFDRWEITLRLKKTLFFLLWRFFLNTLFKIASNLVALSVNSTHSINSSPTSEILFQYFLLKVIMVTTDNSSAECTFSEFTQETSVISALLEGKKKPQ